jgi:flagellar basal body rod protein FlgC
VNEFDILGVAADGMSAQQSAIGVFAKNIAMANAGVSGSTAVEPTFVTAAREDDGDDFTRLVAGRSDGMFGSSSSADAASPVDARFDDADDERLPFIAMTGTHAVPGRTDALGEMVAAMNAQRAFEANSSVFELGKRLAERTIDVGNP